MKFFKKFIFALLATAILSSVPASALTWEEVKEFVKDHKKEILVGTGLVVVLATAAAVFVVAYKRQGGMGNGNAPELIYTEEQYKKAQETAGNLFGQLTQPTPSAAVQYAVMYNQGPGGSRGAYIQIIGPGVPIPVGAAHVSSSYEAVSRFIQPV